MVRSDSTQQRLPGCPAQSSRWEVVVLSYNQYRFQTVREIGRGGLGIVTEIVVTESNGSHKVGTHLALKKLNVQWASNLTALSRFEREIQALKSMNHQSILQIRGENLAGSERFYCMDLYKGSLRDWIAGAAKAPSIGEVAAHFYSIADALEHAHSQGHHHRDIKPENILHTNENAPVVADWGLGYFVHQNSMVLTQLTRGGMGTEYYCSVEQWTTGKCGPEGDVYSLGMTMAEVITGRQNPIQGIGNGITYDILQPSTPAAMKMNQLIRMMTFRDARQRIQTMDDVKGVLASLF
jgi:serine/threonine protein kinase